LIFYSNENLLTFWSNENLLTFWSSLFTSHVDNHFCDIFVPLCHINSFINGNRQKLTDEWICRTYFHFRGLKFEFSPFEDKFVSALHSHRRKWLFTQTKKYIQYLFYNYKIKNVEGNKINILEIEKKKEAHDISHIIQNDN